MAKKLTRIRREGRLTPEQAARDEEIRLKVRDEFPPKPRSKQTVELGLIMTALKEARSQKGLTLADMANRTGIEPPNLSTLENSADANPTIATLRRYAAAIGKRIHVVLDDDPPG